MGELWGLMGEINSLLCNPCLFANCILKNIPSANITEIQVSFTPTLWKKTI